MEKKINIVFVKAVIIICIIFSPVLVLASENKVEVNANVSAEGYVIHSAEAQFKSLKNWYEYKSPQFTTNVTNTGNINFTPLGRINIKNWFGKDIDSVKFNPARLSLDPNNSIKFNNTIFSNHFLGLLGFGKYHAVLTLNYGGGAPTILDAYYWLIPWKIILVVPAAIALIILYLKRKLRK